MLTLQIPKPPCQADELRAGKLDALTCYCYRYLKPLTRYAMFYTRDGHIAEDLATMALEKLWVHRSEMDSSRAVHVFLRKQIYQQVCTWLRQQAMDMKMPPSATNIKNEKPI